jgi:hypothetical protein
MRSALALALALFTLACGMTAVSVLAQDRTPAAPPSGGAGREPPPQAYADCLGKQAGATVQHTTPEGKVPATCTESPKGLVARPSRPRESAPAGPQVKPPVDSAPRSDVGGDSTLGALTDAQHRQVAALVDVQRLIPARPSGSAARLPANSGDS